MVRQIRMKKQQARPCPHMHNPYTSHPVFFTLNITQKKKKKQPCLTPFLFHHRLVGGFNGLKYAYDSCRNILITSVCGCAVQALQAQHISITREETFDSSSAKMISGYVSFRVKDLTLSKLIQGFEFVVMRRVD